MHKTVVAQPFYDAEKAARHLEKHRGRGAQKRSYRKGAAGMAEGLLSGALGKLFAVMEAYPDLKAQDNVARLMEELTATENKIAFSRQHYNDSVASLNTKVESFPANLVAERFGFDVEPYFEIEDPADRSVPQVSF